MNMTALHDYTRKQGVVYSEIMLPPHAPKKFSERSVLWNSVEEIEKSGNAQLAREVEVSLPRELDRESQVQLVKDYVNGCFVSAGMCADFSIHDRQNGNLHTHIMLTMRPLEQSTERKIAGLCLYLKKLNDQKEDRERGPTLADLFDAAMNRVLKDGKHNDAIDFADCAAFLRENSIDSIQGFQETASELWSRCRRVTEQTRQVEDRLHERQEMIRQANVYRENRECYVQYKKTKPRKQADFAESHRTELALYSHAERYLLAHTADRKITLGEWKVDAARLASEKDRLYSEMCVLRNEAKEADAVMRDVKRVIQPEQPQRRQVKRWDMEL